MKLSQAIKIGHQSLMGHKRRSLSVIVTMGILFGLIFGINFIVQGLENTILQAADSASGNSYFIRVDTNPYICSTENITDANGETTFGERICPELDILADITPLAEQYHGQVIPFDHNVLEASDVSSFIQYDLSELPEGVLPVITDLNSALHFYSLNLKGSNPPYTSTAAVIKQVAPDLLGQVVYNVADGYSYAVVGILPSNKIQALTIKRRVDDLSLNPLDAILSIISGGGANISGITVVGSAPTNHNVILVDNGSTSFAEQQFFNGLYQSYYQNYHSVLVKFDNLQEARDFASHWLDGNETVYPDGQEPEHPSYVAFQIFTSQIENIATFDFIKWFLGFVEITIAAIAFIIMIFTCLKVISAESATIKLYRSLGANTGNLCLIYGWYLLELCLLAAGFALLVGILLGLITTVLNASALAQMLTATYSRIVNYPILLLGWNWQSTQAFIAMILAAPICLALCLSKLAKH